jgi:hypothetical protein
LACTKENVPGDLSEWVRLFVDMVRLFVDIVKANDSEEEISR